MKLIARGHLFWIRHLHGQSVGQSAIKATEMTVSLVVCGQSWSGTLSSKPIRDWEGKDKKSWDSHQTCDN